MKKQIIKIILVLFSIMIIDGCGNSEVENDIKHVNEEKSASVTSIEDRELLNSDNESGKDSLGVTVPKTEDTEGNLVWVPINGGTKYHKSEFCSNMEGPMKITLEHAQENGFTACKHCYR